METDEQIANRVQQGARDAFGERLIVEMELTQVVWDDAHKTGGANGEGHDSGTTGGSHRDPGSGPLPRMG